MSSEAENHHLQQLIYHKRYQIMIDQKWGILIANLGASIILLLVLYLSSNTREIPFIAIAVVALSLYRLLTWPESHDPLDLVEAKNNPYHHLVIGMALSGLFWGSIGVWSFDAAEPVKSLVITILLMTIVGGATAAQSPILPAFSLFASLILIPLGIRIFIEPNPIYQVLGIGIIFSLLVNLYIASMLRENINKVIRLHHENAELVNKLKRANDRLLHYSYIDSLTDIPNRRHFDEQAATMWEDDNSANFPLSLIILDIDYFKQYNDSLGHLEGDAVLKHVAEVLVSFADAGTGQAARIGGEEFSVLLPGVDAHKAFITADEIRRAVEQLEIEHGNSDVASVLTISAGVATVNAADDGNAESLHANADEALYSAKASGRNRVVTHE